MATIRKRPGRGIHVRWRELVVTRGTDGTDERRWVERERACPDMKTAERLKREVEQAAALGRRWEDERTAAVSTIGAIVDAFTDMSAVSRKRRTADWRASTIARFIDWAGASTPASELSASLLRSYADHLRDEEIRTVSRYVALVEQVWAWARKQPSAWPGVPDVERITGADLELAHPAPRVAIDTVTWDDVDAMIYALTYEGAPKGQGAGYGYRPQWEHHRRVAIFQRFTGLRVSQILTMETSDVDLKRGRVMIRAGAEGAKGQKRDTATPLHPLLVAAIKKWPKGRQFLFGRRATKGPRRGQEVAPRGDGVAEVFTYAWERAEVPLARWAAVERDRARPTNAIRARWKSAIAGAADYRLAALMVGQSVGMGDHYAYVAMGNPEASPYWAAMLRALEAIPPIGEHAHARTPAGRRGKTSDDVDE